MHSKSSHRLGASILMHLESGKVVIVNVDEETAFFRVDDKTPNAPMAFTELKAHLSRFIAAARSGYRISTVEICKRMDISEMFLWKATKASHSVSLEKLQALACKFGYNVTIGVGNFK